MAIRRTILIFAPHPDDESLACAGIISKALEQSQEVKIIVMTNGDAFKETYTLWSKTADEDRNRTYIDFGYCRQEETIAAMQILGIVESNILFLGYPDGGLFDLLTLNWNRRYFSMTTKCDHSPYSNSLTPHTQYIGINLLNDIKNILKMFHPADIYIPNIKDAHFDHKATNYFIYRGLKEILSKQPDWAIPTIHEYLIHGGNNWPFPLKYSPDLDLSKPPRLPSPDENIKLTKLEKNKKQLAIEKYSTQMKPSDFLLSFIRANEVFWIGNYKSSLPSLFLIKIGGFIENFFDELILKFH